LNVICNNNNNISVGFIAELEKKEKESIKKSLEKKKRGIQNNTSK